MAKRVADYETRITDLLDLRAFALAADLRSLTAAAHVLGESKATLSRRITRIERELGVALLRRSSLGVEPTEEGAGYRIRIGHVLELLGDANAAVAHAGQARPSGQLRISIPPGLAGALVPMLASFGAKYPEVTLVVDISSRFVDLVAEHFDVALRVADKLADSTLVARRISGVQTEGIFVASPGYLADRPAPRRPVDLANHRVLALGTSGAATALPIVRRGTTQALDLRVPIVLAGTDLGFVLEMALHGAGIAILPRVSVQSAIADGRLVQVLASYCWPTSGLFLVHRSGPFVAPKLRAFLDHARDTLTRK